jgi:sortase A
LLLAVYAGAFVRATWTSRADRYAFLSELDGSSPVPSEADGAGTAPGGTAWREPVADTREWSWQRIAAWAGSAAPTPRLGLLEVPSAGLAVVLFDGTDAATLDRGVGRIEGTAHPDARGNLGIAGHRDGFFRGLRHVAPGDPILLRTRHGARHYQVEWMRVVGPDDVWVLEPAAGDALTLVTCHPFWFVGSAPERFVVRAVAAER